MVQPDANAHRRRGLPKSLGLAALTGATVAALALPGVAQAQPAPPPPPPPAPVVEGAPPPAAPPPAAPPPPVIRTPRSRHRSDPNAPPPPPPGRSERAAAPGRPERTAAPGRSQRPAAPAGPEPGRVDNAAGGFSYVVPAGWKVADAQQLSYGQALLSKLPPAGSPPDAQPPNDTSVLLGRLDLKLFAGAETDNTKAAQRLASDMGEFFMPFPGTRVNQQTGAAGRRRHDRCRLVLRGEVHRHHQAQRPDLGRCRRRTDRRGHPPRSAGTRALVRRVARHGGQPDPAGRGGDAGQLDPAVDAAASAAAAGPERPAATAGSQRAAA